MYGVSRIHVVGQFGAKLREFATFFEHYLPLLLMYRLCEGPVKALLSDERARITTLTTTFSEISYIYI